MLDVRPIGIEDYAERCSKPLSQLHDKLWVETYSKTHNPQATVGSLGAQFLKLLVGITGARRILEVGMFTGYCTLAFAEALPKGGTITACEIDPAAAEVARRYLAEGDHAGKVDIRIGPALETLKRVWGPYDLCFIDADRENYGAYYDACLELVRARGLLVIDSVLRDGRVLDPQDELGKSLDDLNKRIRNDARVENVLLPVRDGVMLVRKL